MSIEIKKISISTFQKNQEIFPTSNFLQSAQMAELQKQRGKFQVDTIGIYQNQKLIGQCVILYRKTAILFKEAIILYGPLMDFSDSTLTSKVLKTLKLYLKKEKIATISIHPNIVQNILTPDLEYIEKDLAQNTLQVFIDNGFQHYIDKTQSLIPNQIFIKSLSDFQSKEDLHQTYAHSLRKDIKKINASKLKIKELTLENLDEFYNIFQSTGSRKSFAIQEFPYFTSFKKVFKDQAKFLLAYIDCNEYRSSLKKQAALAQEEIDELLSKEQTKKVKGAILNATSKLNSANKRLAEFDNFDIKSEILPVSSILFVTYGKEVVSFVGGNYEEFITFGGATLLNSNMVDYALENGFECYNFFGTIETDKAQKGSGNFKFKRQFNGKLEQLIGGFTLDINPLLKLIKKFIATK